MPELLHHLHRLLRLHLLLVSLQARPLHPHLLTDSSALPGTRLRLRLRVRLRRLSVRVCRLSLPQHLRCLQGELLLGSHCSSLPRLLLFSRQLLQQDPSLRRSRCRPRSPHPRLRRSGLPPHSLTQPHRLGLGHRRPLAPPPAPPPPPPPPIWPSSSRPHTTSPPRTRPPSPTGSPPSSSPTSASSAPPTTHPNPSRTLSSWPAPALSSWRPSPSPDPPKPKTTPSLSASRLPPTWTSTPPTSPSCRSSRCRRLTRLPPHRPSCRPARRRGRWGEGWCPSLPSRTRTSPPP